MERGLWEMTTFLGMILVFGFSREDMKTMYVFRIMRSKKTF